jgi:alkylation response protein AidB-like acyl-CoA dehydrogenase
MDLGVTDVQRRLREQVRGWLASTSPPSLTGDLAQRFELARRWQSTLYDAGYLGWGWPEEYGGRGGSLLDQVVIYEELIAARAPMPAGLVGLEVVGPSIAHFATPSQGIRFVGPLLRGEEIWSQGFSEPDAGSDLASLRTKAVAAGGGFRISGQKVWTSWAQFSHWCAVLARTDPDAPKHRGITFFLVDLASPGVEIRPIRQPGGEEEFSELFLDDVFVPDDNILGGLNQGWQVTMKTLSNERGPAMIRRLGELRAAHIDLLEALPAEPDAFALDHIGRATVLMEVMRARTYRIAERVRSGEVSAEDSIDKVFLTRVEQTLFGSALDLLEPDRTISTRWLNEYLFGRAASIYGGTSEIQHNIIAERWLGLGKV